MAASVDEVSSSADVLKYNLRNSANEEIGEKSKVN